MLHPLPRLLQSPPSCRLLMIALVLPCACSNADKPASDASSTSASTSTSAADADADADAATASETLSASDAIGPDTADTAPTDTPDAGCQTAADCPAPTDNPCATAGCTAGKCITLLLPDNAACATADLCKVGQRCEAGTCTGGKTQTCDDANACTDDICLSDSGQCKFVPSADGKVCQDADACTENDVCKAGTCITGLDTCECKADKDCANKDDGDLCNGAFYCKFDALGRGGCTHNAASVVHCDKTADSDCAANTCDPATGTCAIKHATDNAPCDDQDPLTQGDACETGSCKAGTFVAFCTSNADCAKWDDGNLCNGLYYCNKAAGACSLNPASVVNCPTVDDTPCSTTTCAPKTGECAAVAAPPNATCTDANECTVGDVCAAGKCLSGTAVCACKTDADCSSQASGDACLGPLFCNKQAGTCALNPAQKVTCPTVDDTLCHRNLCQPKSGKCTLTPINLHKDCTDGDPCTAGDTCDASGKCAPGNNRCECTKDPDCAAKDDGDLCNGVFWCDKTAKPFFLCAAKPSSAVVCPTVDDTACRASMCDKKTGDCALGAVISAVGKACDDNNPCTVSTTCSGGDCKGVPKDCGDANACTADSCTPSTDCVHEPLAATCSDDNACTTGDHCVGKACQPAAALGCDDGNPCTADSCAPELGCAATPTSATCDDGDNCTQSDACSGGKCVPGKPLDCDDGDVCTVAHACKAGVCDKGQPKNCDDANACTDDTCDAKAGCNNAENTASCTVQDACIAPGTCASGACVAGKPRLFALTWASNLWRAATGVLELSDGTLVVVGNERAAATGDANILVAHHTPDGALTSAQIIEKTGHFAASAVARAGAGYLVVGSSLTAAGAGDAVAIKRTANGTTVWTRALGSAGQEQADAAVELGAGHVLAGAAVGAGQTHADGWMVGIDDGGKQQWQWTAGDELDDRLHGVADDGDGAVAVGRWQEPQKPTLLRTWLVRVAAGKTVWSRVRRATVTDDSWGQAVVAHANGGWFVAGQRVAGVLEVPWLAGYDRDGAWLWQTPLASKDLGPVRAMTARKAGGVWLVGDTATGDGTQLADVWFARLDPLGQLVGDVQIPSVPGWQGLSAVAELADGGVVAVGVDKGAAGKQGDIVLWRMDRWGHTSCEQSGVCAGKSDTDCGAGVCKIARCTKQDGCVAVPIALPCDDGLACTTSDACQSGACKPGGAAGWTAAFGASKPDNGYALALTANGDVLVAGDTQSTGKPLDGLLVRTTATGSKLWQTYWGPAHGLALVDVAAGYDGTIAAVGTDPGDATSTAIGRLLRIDSGGKLLSDTKLIGDGGDAAAHALALTEDGRHVVVGDAWPGGGAAPKARIGRVFVADPRGELDAARSAKVDHAGTDVDTLRAVTVGDAEVAVAVGSVAAAGQEPDGWLVAVGIDKANDVRWQTALGSDGADELVGVTRLAGNTMLAAGHTTTGPNGELDGWLVAVAADTGKTLWQRANGGPYHDRLRAIAPVVGGGFAAVGSRAFDGVIQQGWLLRLDAQGALLFERHLAKGLALWDVAALPDGAIQLAGTLPGTVGGDPADAWTGRADRWGNLVCHDACQTTLGKPGACDDGKPCTADVCDGATGKCKITVAFEGEQCADGGVCLAKATCDKGVCKGVSKLWERTLGGDYFDRIDAISAPFADQEFALGGRTSSLVKQQLGGWLTRVDSAGVQAQSTALYAGQACTVFDVLRVQGATYVAGGVNHPSQLKYGGYWSKRSDDGAAASKTHIVADGITTGRFRGLAATAAGHVMVGWAQKSASDANSGWFVRLDPDSTKVLANVLLGDNAKEDRFYGLVAVGKDIVTVGRSESLADKTKEVAWLQTLDKDGAQVVGATFSPAAYAQFNAVAALPSGVLVAVGEARASSFGATSAFVALTSAKGDIGGEWLLKLPSSTLADVAAVPSGFAVVGTTTQDVLLQSWTDAGKVRWSRTFHVAKDEGTALARYGDTLLVAAATWTKGTSPVNDDVDTLLLRTDFSGNTVCNTACAAAKPLVCNDGNPCTADFCDGKTGKCSHPPLAVGIPCS